MGDRVSAAVWKRLGYRSFRKPVPGWCWVLFFVCTALPACASVSPASQPRSERISLGILLAGITLTSALAFRARVATQRLGGEIQALRILVTRQAEELVQAREALAETQRLNALGLLTASLMHDLNNHLSNIRMSNKLISRAVPGHPEIQSRVQIIESSIQQVRGMVESFLGFGQRREGMPRKTDVAAEVSGILQLLRDEFLPGLQVSVTVSESAPLAAVHNASFRRILLNLLINACEAMEKQGRLLIQVDFAATMAFGSAVLTPKTGPPWIRLRIIDTGPGIASENLARLFQPFFTTKHRENRKGSGLGLYIVQTLAAEEGIGLKVSSEPGVGTTFELFLPPAADPDPS